MKLIAARFASVFRSVLRSLSALGLLSLALLLSACGGGAEPDLQPHAADLKTEAVTVADDGSTRKQALAAWPNTAIPATAHQMGMWGPLYDWPLVAVHAVLLPDGQVLSYGSRADGTQTGRFEVDVWDNLGTPASGHLLLPNNTGTDLFCSAQLLLPPVSASSPASVFIAGGDNWTGRGTTNSGNNNSNLFTPNPGNVASSSLVQGNNMTRARWYASATTLIDGQTYVQGGSGGTDRPELRDATGGFRVLSGADTSALQFMYPRNHVLPDGRLFGYDSNGAMYFVNTGGNGSLVRAGNFAGQYGSADAASAMFQPGRILQFGGNSNGALVIDVTGSNPVVTPTQSMSAQRRLVSATLLPNGHVLATGGSRIWNDPNTASYSAEIWNPQSGQWLQGPAAARPRLYHSNALLLPDATVLVTGGGAALRDRISALERNAQIYYPPYLFSVGGVRAPRPNITAAPTWLNIGQTFVVQTAGALPIARVVLMKTGSATHNWNMEQRFVELAFSGAGNTWSVQAPTRAGIATPGYYMLFVFDTAGVPSEAKFLRIGVAANANPALTPVLADPGPRSSVRGTAVNLQLSASDPNGDPLRFSGSGLPPGLSLDSSSGRISGSPSTAGNYNAVLAVSDGVNSASINLAWTVTEPVPLLLTAAPVPSASLAGASASFSANASGEAVQFQWNFGDGSPTTAWSSSGGAGHVYAQPGSYIVTLSVRSTATNEFISRSLLQTVHLPATANAPGVSTSLLVETPALGNARLWVVNRDHNTVTAFDAATRTRLGEVVVGDTPRSIARAADGLLWVSNQRSASISVINPATRTVVRTIVLPRASQPVGLVMSPSSAQAFVALQASGQLLRFDSASYTQTGALALGPQITQVSVSATGAQVYVSRFITPPLPGESTAVVSTPATAGGQVLEVNATSMSLTRTIVLTHSTLADGENQGRGVPNYLGAAVISPDGSQAYVPGKLDNVLRGTLRDGQALNFQNTVRAASSRLLLTGAAAGSEDLARRLDHDNASLASAALFDRRGSLLFVALETSREVAVLDAHGGRELMRFEVGRAPQGLALASDGKTLFVNNFMDRSVSAHDLRPLLDQGLYSVPTLAVLPSAAAETLTPQVLLGKQLFYDARDPRLARDGYMSCASCHHDGGHDGRTWDLSHSGEGLRNTISLRGRAGGQGRLHWSANFDEVQDFEGQIRALAGGTGLMSDAQFNSGTRSQPLGDRKAGVSADLDALAAYVASLNRFDASPARLADGSLTAAASAGKAVFAASCASCHEGVDFSDSAKQVLHQIGSQTAASGQRAFQTLNGLDAPTLRDAWATAPYLHNGAALTLEAAVLAHTRIDLSPADLAAVVAYTAQIGAEETAAPSSSANLVVRALATLANHVGALFEVRVNGSSVGAGQLDSGGWVNLLFNVATLVKDSIVEMVFKNDASTATEDRNLAVQAIQINGSTTVPASAPSVLIDRGSGAAAFDGVNTVAASSTGGWMPWDAAIRFSVPATAGSDTVTLRGSATLAGGIGAAIDLYVNGVKVGSQTLNSSTVQNLAFTTPSIAAGDRIDVVFTNDATINGQDRNLYVESVTARNTVLPATAASVLIDRGSGVRAFDGLDLVPTSSTGGWLPWNGALRLVAR